MKKFLILLYLSIYVFATYTAYAEDKNIIYIYKDDGVSEESLIQTIGTFSNFLDSKYQVETINAKEVQESTWIKSAALFILPGGADLPYVKKLNGIGNQKIKQYIEEGGSFLGICAGSYYASSYVEFNKDGPLEVIGDRELKFFQGKAVGPILAPYDYKTQSGSRAVEISTIFSEVPKTVVYYNGGDFFENAENFPNTRVIATYDNKLPAIIYINYGKGKALLSGVHFEYDPHLLDSKDKYISKIIKPLTNFNDSRKILIHKLLQMLDYKDKDT